MHAHVHTPGYLFLGEREQCVRPAQSSLAEDSSSRKTCKLPSHFIRECLTLMGFVFIPQSKILEGKGLYVFCILWYPQIQAP